MSIEAAIRHCQGVIAFHTSIAKSAVSEKTSAKHIKLVKLEKTKLAALEKQLPKKPILIEDKMYLCPNKRCQNVLLFKYELYPDVLNTRIGLNYCLGCGQKIDWSEEE